MKRQSFLLIEELLDADHNCPFRGIMPIFMIEAWAKKANKPVPISIEDDSDKTMDEVISKIPIYN